MSVRLHNAHAPVGKVLNMETALANEYEYSLTKTDG